jgi:hypothetical protein
MNFLSGKKKLIDGCSENNLNLLQKSFLPEGCQLQCLAALPASPKLTLRA